MNPKDEIKDAFITVGIELRAKMGELSNARQIKEAREIEKAYEIINKYFDDALMWPEGENLITQSAGDEIRQKNYDRIQDR